MHFHDWIDYNEVAFSLEFLEWGRIFSGLGGGGGGGKNILACREFGYENFLDDLQYKNQENEVRVLCSV